MTVATVLLWAARGADDDVSVTHAMTVHSTLIFSRVSKHPVTKI